VIVPSTHRTFITIADATMEVAEDVVRTQGACRKPILLRFNQTTPPANPPHSSVQAFVGMRRMLRPYPDRLAGRVQLEAFSGESSQGRPTRSNSCRSRGRRRCVSRSSAMSSSTPAASADPVASLRIFANRRAAIR
jgi:hypothetical protein